MTALRQEAFQILEALPEERLVSVIRYMRGYEREETPSANHYLTDALTGISSLRTLIWVWNVKSC